MGLLTDFFTPIATAAATQYVTNMANPRPSLANISGYPPGGGFNMQQPVDIGIPFVDIISEPPQVACGPQPVYKKVCGAYRWVIPKKRRRKQLLTNSDAAGLAKLKGLVGVGKTMDTWIATHS